MRNLRYVQSGDSDRVNPVIDELEGLQGDARAQVFDAWFEDLTAVYTESDDGYVRQSVVRAVEQLVPRLEVLGLLGPDELEDRLEETDLAALREQTDALCGFLLEALQDEDGRVRQAAKRGLRDVFRNYDAVDDTETIKGIIAELDELGEKYSGKREKHIVETREHAEFFLQSAGSRIMEGFEKMLNRRQDHDT